MSTPSTQSPSGRRATILAGLHRQLEHIRQHARHEQWEDMLAAIGRLESTLIAWQRQSPLMSALVAEFVRQEMPALREDFNTVQGRLRAESAQIQESRRKLRAAREFSVPVGDEPGPRLNVSA